MTKRQVKSIFGNVALLKAYCIICKGYAFVIDGILQCCDSQVEIPKRVIVKREVQGEAKRPKISKAIKDAILRQQGERCIYCESLLDGWAWDGKKGKNIKLKIHFDHFISWAYSGDSQQSNLVAACHICNGLKSDKYFPDLASAQAYLQLERIKRGIK